MIWILLLYVISIILCVLSNIYRYNLGKQEIESMTDTMYKSKAQRKSEIAQEVIVFGVLGFVPIINTMLFFVQLFIVITDSLKDYIEDSL